MRNNYNENFLSLVINYSKGYKVVFEEHFDELYSIVNKNFIKNNYEIIIVNNLHHETDFIYLNKLCKKYENIRILFVEDITNDEALFSIGLANSIGDLIITIDISRHPKTIILEFLELNKKENFEFIIGAQKDLLKSKYSLKTTLYKLYYSLLSYYSEKKINFALSSCRFFTRKAINHFINKNNNYQIGGYFNFYPGLKVKHLEFSNLIKYDELNKKNLTEKIDKAINLLMITSSFPIRLIKFILNFVIIINLIYINYVIIFTFKEGIGSGWSSISFQNSFMFLLLFLVLRIFFSFHLKSEKKNENLINKVTNEISSFNLDKFKNINNYDDEKN
jgi:hypothetical protein